MATLPFRLVLVVTDFTPADAPDVIRNADLHGWRTVNQGNCKLSHYPQKAHAASPSRIVLPVRNGSSPPTVPSAFDFMLRIAARGYCDAPRARQCVQASEDGNTIGQWSDLPAPKN